MSRFSSVLFLACIMTFPMMLGGCAGALIVGVLRRGYAAARERECQRRSRRFWTSVGVERFVDAGRLQRHHFTSIGARAVDRAGRDGYQSAYGAVAAVAGIKGLYDEVEVAPPGSTWDATKDAWITARLRSEMMLDPDVRSGNYTIDTSNATVYLIGSARTPAELERATGIARYIPGVKRVVSYVELRPGAPLAGASATIAPTIRGAPSGPSVAPIQVQKL